MNSEQQFNNSPSATAILGRSEPIVAQPPQGLPGIYITDKARAKVIQLKNDAGLGDDYFVRVGVVGGGCSGLSYKLDFDNESQPKDQVFEDKGIRLVTDLKSFLYLCDTELDFSDGLNGKGFHFVNPNASRTCGCGESFSV